MTFEHWDRAQWQQISERQVRQVARGATSGPIERTSACRAHSVCAHCHPLLFVPQIGGPSWKEDDATDSCENCGMLFNIFVRRHHCRCALCVAAVRLGPPRAPLRCAFRYCGRIFCHVCTSVRRRLVVFGYGLAEPVHANPNAYATHRHLRSFGSVALYERALRAAAMSQRNACASSATW
jgi:hypothetical protein